MLIPFGKKWPEQYSALLACNNFVATFRGHNNFARGQNTIQSGHIFVARTVLVSLKLAILLTDVANEKIMGRKAKYMFSDEENVVVPFIGRNCINLLRCFFKEI